MKQVKQLRQAKARNPGEAREAREAAKRGDAVTLPPEKALSILAEL